ncbi:uncharacterized protein LOC112090262 [Morus notabilis]|uniref:uncharacterized protein LOC112090262 n=1 Tax=Morus notabilis TaxID=981085 RepID=UPI000CED1C28|nr:uncharacterized protein LOC112090262 [Morus notabilis]
MKQTLLTRMKILLNRGMKIQTIRAWGLFIQLLGSYALKNRKLINDMLKIPEYTFADHDPQLQIASQVAWEGLIDALISPAILPYKRNASVENGCCERMGISKWENSDIQANGFSKSVKLIMKPLIGVMSSKCDASVHASCFNTWCNLLHKLDSFVNCSPVKQLVLEPIYEAVFQTGPDCKSIWLWNQCIDFLNASILAKCRDVNKETSGLESHHLSGTASITETFTKCSWKRRYPIKWLQWELTHLDFHLKIIYILINQASKTSFSRDKRSLAYAASLRLFRSVSKGVQMELKKSSTTFDVILLGLTSILKFVKDLCEETSEGSDRDDLHGISLQLIEIVSEEIEPAMLGSPLYKMALDLKYIESQSVADETRNAKFLEMCSITYMDMVSPTVYLTVLYFYVMAQSNLNTSNADFMLKAIEKYFKILLLSYDPLENFIITVGLLFKLSGLSCLRMWSALAKGLKDCIGDIKNILSFTMDHRSACIATCNFLCYPFVICHLHWKDLISAKISGSLEDSHVPLQEKLELEQVIELWKSLYGSLFECFITNKFSEYLCNMLDGWLNKYTSMFESANELEASHKDLHLDNISFYGSIVIFVLEKSKSSELRLDTNDCHMSNTSEFKILSGMNSRLTLAIR